MTAEVPPGDVVDDRWEMGSEFHWDDRAIRPAHGSQRSWSPTPYAHFSSGTGALRALLALLPGTPAIHFPSYFCIGVVKLLEPYAPIRFYREIPDGKGPDLDSVDAAPGDVVLGVNLFGRGDQSWWDQWDRAATGTVLVEDHTHDPSSAWARSSSADYCVASLRKTLPLPDGAIAWSPAGLELPRPSAGESPAAAAKLSAMVLKSAWMLGGALHKPDFRELASGGEQEMSEGTFSPTALARLATPDLDVHRLRAARAANAGQLLHGLSGVGEHVVPLTYGPSGIVPFNVQVLCADNRSRDALRTHLTQRRIYAAVHWPQPLAGIDTGDARAVDIAGRILTIPVDYRYSSADVERALTAIAEFRPGSAG